MVILHSYVKLPEGTFRDGFDRKFHHVQHEFPHSTKKTPTEGLKRGSAQQKEDALAPFLGLS